MGYILAGVAMVLKLTLAACLAMDGDALGALVVAILSPSLFLIASDSRVRRAYIADRLEFLATEKRPLSAINPTLSAALAKRAAR